MKVFRVYKEIPYEGPSLDSMRLFFNEIDAREYVTELSENGNWDDVVMDETIIE
jgi:hypothetical protein